MRDIPKERRDKAKKAFENLHGDGLIIFHKGRNCASINSSSKEEIREIMRGEVPEYIMDLR